MEFVPGAYTKGDIVTVNGVQYVADRDMLNAQAIPKDNMYWTMVPPTEPIPVQSTGLSTTNTPEQNSTAWETFINSKPLGFVGSVYIPAGTYEFARTMRIDARPIHLYGDNGTVFGNSTKLSFPGDSDGILITRGGTSYQETIIERLLVVSRNRNAPNGYGISSHARVKIRDCTAKGFSLHGFNIWGAMEHGSEASGSLIESCHSLENGGDGFRVGHVDGNAMTIINCDARDNDGYGFNDDSFLGNTFIGCMAHYNKAGDFFNRDWNNARSLFMGCYSESGNAKHSRFGQHVTVIGGMWGTHYTISVDEIARHGYIKDALK